MLLRIVCTACQINSKFIVIRPFFLGIPTTQLPFSSLSPSVYYSTTGKLLEQVTSAKFTAKSKLVIREDEAFIIGTNATASKVSPSDLLEQLHCPTIQEFPMSKLEIMGILLKAWTRTRLGYANKMMLAHMHSTSLEAIQKKPRQSNLVKQDPPYSSDLDLRNDYEFTTKISADCLTPSQISIEKTPLKLVNALHGRILQRKKLELVDIPGYYLSLAKSRLTSLVVITAMAGYALAPAAFNLETFLYLSVGTALTSASANCINQMVEVPYDSKMDRTKNRVLVNELLSIPHALAFALVSAGTGVATLYLGANELAAVLGAANLFLYTSVYTPLKRQSILNTWVGSVVGAIPPLMGWAAATGVLDTTSLIIAGVLYSWQFVHFNSLSWNLKNDYKKGGYRMMSVTHPDLCRRTALRYSLSLFPLCTLAPVMELTSWTFAFDSVPVNGYLTYLAWKFYRDADSSSSRKLFRFSLIHLPALIILMLISKKWSSQNTSTTKESKELSNKS